MEETVGNLMQDEGSQRLSRVDGPASTLGVGEAFLSLEV